MLGSFFRGVMKRVLRPAPTTAPPFEGGGVDEWTVRGVRFDDRALRPGSASPSTMSWTDAQGAAIDLATTEDSEPIEAAALGRYRDEQRRVAHAQGRGLVSVDVRATSTGLLLLEVVTKAARGLGYDYI